MARLEEMLPPTATLLGIDEHTAVVLDFAGETAQVIGRGGATVRRGGEERTFSDGDTFPLTLLGDIRLPTLGEGLPADVVEAVLAVEQAEEEVPSEVMALIKERETARRARDWARADALREEIGRLGYVVEDTSEGPRWRRARSAG